MAKILLIETATEVCSAGIAVDGRVVALAEENLPTSHAARLTTLIQDCIQQSGIALAELDALAVSRGPGSYTSLRVGVSTAKGICYALDKPLIAVDTLQALAVASLVDYGMGNADYTVHPEVSQNEEGNNPHSVIRIPHSVFALPMLDARREEVWTALFNLKMQEVVSAQPLILKHELFYKFTEQLDDFNTETVFVISGNGAKKMKSAGINENVVFGAVSACSAKYLAEPAERFFQNKDFQDITYFEPFYMKPPNITIQNKPLF